MGQSEFWRDLSDRQDEGIRREERRGEFLFDHWWFCLLIAIVVAWQLPLYLDRSHREAAFKNRVAPFCWQINPAEQIAAFPCSATERASTSKRQWRCLGSAMYQWRPLDDYVACRNN
jgi:hypothetical protein